MALDEAQYKAWFTSPQEAEKRLGDREEAAEQWKEQVEKRKTKNESTELQRGRKGTFGHSSFFSTVVAWLL